MSASVDPAALECLCTSTSTRDDITERLVGQRGTCEKSVGYFHIGVGYIVFYPSFSVDTVLPPSSSEQGVHVQSPKSPDIR